MTAAAATEHPDIVYPATLPFLILHVSCLGVLWTGVTARALLLCALLYLVRLFAITAGYHRYFSHRSYRTSRVGQFVLALVAQSSTQRGALWWAAIHRHHHLHSDTELDVHSRLRHGFWYAHMGWIFAAQNDRPDYSLVRDLQEFPELAWLDRHPYFLPSALAIVPCWLLAGWSGVIVGFCWSTTVLYHITFAINSMGHAHGTQPYITGDESRNSLWLALLTFGEGWHNNHHAYQSSTRVGFHAREVDIGYLLLKLLARLGLVWDLREPPSAVVRNEVPPGRRVVERVARDVVASVLAETSARTLAHHPTCLHGNEAAPALAGIEQRVRSRYPDATAANVRCIALLARDLLMPHDAAQPDTGE